MRGQVTLQEIRCFLTSAISTGTVKASKGVPLFLAQLVCPLVLKWQNKSLRVIEPTASER
jgi:hypothetical protein